MRKFDNVRKKEITFENKVNVPPLQRVGKKRWTISELQNEDIIAYAIFIIYPRHDYEEKVP